MPSNMARVEFDPLTGLLTTDSAEDSSTRHGLDEFKEHSYTSIYFSLDWKPNKLDYET